MNKSGGIDYKKRKTTGQALTGVMMSMDSVADSRKAVWVSAEWSGEKYGLTYMWEVSGSVNGSNYSIKRR